MDKASILIIYTGGTIGMVRDESTGALTPVDLQSLYENIPVLEKFPCRLEFIAFDPLLDSSDIHPGHWVEIATIIEKNYEAYDGFVVLHGSDTMAYTASGLSFMLENLNKPVILTGSQLPLGMIRTDGRENFVTAIEIAASYTDDTPVIPEVAVYFENQLFRGNRTTKYNAEHFEAFLSGNYPLLAEVGVNIHFKKNYILKPNFRKLKVHKNLDRNVAVLTLYPGITETVVSAMIDAPGLKGLILHTYGSGNAPSERWFLDKIDKAVKKGMMVVNVTQCLSGSVEMGKYQTSIELARMGVISGRDITLESALAKMMYLLGAGYDMEQVKRFWSTSLRGEISTE